MEAKIDSEGAFVFDKWSDFHLSEIETHSLEQLTAYVFVTDAMNFCFWPDNPSGQFEYEHMTRNLEKILKADPEFFTLPRLAVVTEQEIREKVFDGNTNFALIDERARLVREIGCRLSEKQMSFVQFVQNTPSCSLLVKAIIDTFEGFRDQAIYKGRQTFFYKRAQILVADLVGAYDDFGQARPDLQSSIPTLTNHGDLTMFADYRVPQILRHRGIFVYSETLANAIDSETELAYSSELEVELRAATITTVDRIFAKAQECGSDKLKQQLVYAFQVDWILWQLGEKSLAEMLPHHKVLSIYY